MKRIRFSGIRKFFNGRGFAAALVLSITAVGVSAYVAYNATVSRLAEEGDDSGVYTGDADPVNNPQNDIPREPDNSPGGHTQPPPTQPNDPNAPCAVPCAPELMCEYCLAQEANNFIRPESPRVLPVEGEIIKPFSNGELVKSHTLGVWRTHDAVDIGASLGTEVGSMQRGAVIEVYENPMWGICVAIDHGDGIISSYMGLAQDVKVTVGQEIEAGHVIGLVGNTAEAEIADPPSLHFAVRVNDAWVDPIEYINGGSH